MNKTFDCVEMKNRLQAELREQEQRLGSEEIRKRRKEWLTKGEDALACWWRTIPTLQSPAHEPLVLHEDPATYRIGNDPKR